MRKKLLILPLLICIFIILSGCWDYLEYENMAVISAVGVDYNSQTDEFVISLQKLSATKAGTQSVGQSETQVNKVGAVHTITCKTMYEGMNKFQSIISNKLFFGYTDVLLISEDAAKYKLLDIIDLVDRTPSLRANTNIAIVKNAVETLSTVDYSKTMPSSSEISNLIQQSVNSGLSRPVTLQDFEEMLAISGLEAVSPYIKASSNEETEAKGGVEDGIRSYQERIGNHILAGTAVFKGDKFLGYLNEKESLGYLWITGKQVHNYKTSLPKAEEDYAYYYIKSSKSSLSVELSDNKPVIKIKISTMAELRKDSNTIESTFILEKELGELEANLSESIRSDIEAALKKCQKEYKTDVFGFGFELFRKDPKLWTDKYEKEWDKIYTELPVYISVDSIINSTGTNIKKFVVK